MLGVGLLAFLVRGADNPPDPVLVPAGAATGPSGAEPGLGPAATGASMAPSTTTPPAPAPATATSPPPASSAPPPARSSPALPTTEAPPLPPPVGPARRPLPGFGEVAFRVTSAAGGTFDGVALLADNDATRSQGLMEQRDLRGYDGMVFRFPAPSDVGFYMRNTRIPLSIAYFDTTGRFVSSADMTPCPDRTRDCPSYPPAGPYLHTIEVALGDLARLGIGPGSVLSFP